MSHIKENAFFLQYYIAKSMQNVCIYSVPDHSPDNTNNRIFTIQVQRMYASFDSFFFYVKHFLFSEWNHCLGHWYELQHFDYLPFFSIPMFCLLCACRLPFYILIATWFGLLQSSSLGIYAVYFLHLKMSVDNFSWLQIFFFLFLLSIMKYAQSAASAFQFCVSHMFPSNSQTWCLSQTH